MIKFLMAGTLALTLPCPCAADGGAQPAGQDSGTFWLVLVNDFALSGAATAMMHVGNFSNEASCARAAAQAEDAETNKHAFKQMGGFYLLCIQANDGGTRPPQEK